MDQVRHRHVYFVGYDTTEGWVTGKPTRQEWDGVRWVWPSRDARCGCGHVGPVSRRQLDILLLCAEGKTRAEIGGELGIGASTVKNQLSSAFRRLGARNLIEALIALGWLGVPR